MRYEMIDVPEHGEPITVNTDFTIHVPDTPIIPFIEGDGIGRD
ncbi:MAG: NADP-dependent isocitrate dehydrogenase, partial [Gammaproteobacteria bacterium]